MNIKEGHLNFPHLAHSVSVGTTCYSPAAAHPERFCRPCPGHTDGKRLGEKKKTAKSHVNLIELWISRNTTMWRSCTLTEQLVCPAVERLAGWGVLVLLIVLDRSEVSQSPHEAPEVHLVLSKKDEREEHNCTGTETERRDQLERSKYQTPRIWFDPLRWLRLRSYSLAAWAPVNTQTACNLTPSVSRLCSQVFLQQTWPNQNTKKLIREAMKNKSVWLTEIPKRCTEFHEPTWNHKWPLSNTRSAEKTDPLCGTVATKGKKSPDLWPLWLKPAKYKVCPTAETHEGQLTPQGRRRWWSCLPADWWPALGSSGNLLGCRQKKNSFKISQHLTSYQIKYWFWRSSRFVRTYQYISGTTSRMTPGSVERSFTVVATIQLSESHLGEDGVWLKAVKPEQVEPKVFYI